LHNTSLWDKAINLDVAFQQESKSTLLSQCRTFVPWDSSPEGVLRHFIYNQWVEVKTLNFDHALHYCLIKDNDGVVQAKVDEVSLLIAHFYISFLTIFL
jgi:hypothetical protein